MKENMVLEKNKDLITRVIDDETILLPVYKTSDEINCIYTLDKCASRVWELIDGKRSLGRIKKKILDEFDTTPEEADKEINNLLNDLREINGIGEKCQKK